MKNISKLIGISLLAVCLTDEASAQYGYYNDALLFGQTQFGGTARVQGIGGTQVALGGDQSSAVSNPAGLGFYNRSTFVFTPSVVLNDIDATYQESTISNYKNNFNIAQLGVVFNYSKGDIVKDKFKGGSLGVTVSRVNDFNNEIRYEGENFNNSIIDSFLESAHGLNPSDLGGYEGIAYEHYLINPIYEDSLLVGYGSDVGGFPIQQENILTWGGQYQVSLAWGGNYDDRIFFGAGLGFQTVNYNQERNYVEWDFVFNDGTADDILDKIYIKDMLYISGTGVNANFGLILRPIPYVSIGASYTSPTYFNLDQEYKYNFTTEWSSDYVYVNDDSTTVSPGYKSDRSDLFLTRYDLRSPAKVNLGAAIFLGKHGFISGDLEFVDFSESQLKSQDFIVTADNQEINNLYSNAMNYRLGAEWRIDQLRFKGGYSYMDDPYKNTSQFDRSRSSYTFGAGFRTRDYFIDLAVVNTKFKSYYNPYSISFDQPVAEVKNDQTTLNVSVGFVF